MTTVELASGPQSTYLAFRARCQVLNGHKQAALVTTKKTIDAASKDDKVRYEKQLAEIQKGN